MSEISDLSGTIEGIWICGGIHEVSHGLMTWAWAQDILAEHQKAILSQRNNFLIVIGTIQLLTVNI